ncbi:MAG TPA: hypothetical protein PLH29_03960 [bacterium]|nr:hypothetical protein [bacterium]
MNIEEGIFKTIFFLAIVVFIITVIGIFLLLVKILLLFTPEITIMGINMT